jgi:hypothetical protein
MPYVKEDIKPGCRLRIYALAENLEKFLNFMQA